MLTLRKEFHYEVEVSAVLLEGKLKYFATLETGMMSHFDFHADYCGSTMEEALQRIATALESALEQLHAL